MFDQLFEIVPDAMIVVDDRGVIVQANTQAERMFGFDRHGLVGVGVEELMPAAVRGRHRLHRTGYMARPRVRPMGATGQTLVGRRNDGTEFPIEIALSPIDGDGGTRYLASIRDVADSQRARQALVRAGYDKLVARIGQLALAVNDEDAILARLPAELIDALSIDAVAVVLRQADAGRLRLRAARGFDPAEEAALARSFEDDALSGQLIASARPLILDDLAAMRDPRVPPELAHSGFRSGVLVPLLDRERAVGVLAGFARAPSRFDHDAMHCLQSVANLVSAFMQRRRSEEQLAHAQRLESIGQLTGGIAHDFNNLLTVVSGNLQLLALECGDRPDLHDLLAGAERAVTHGAALTAKLLAFARRQRLSPHALDPAMLLQDLAGVLRRTLGEPIRIDIAIEGPLSPVYADHTQLESALLNLAVNARDAMPRGGTLIIGAREADIRSADPDTKLPAGRYVVFAIADTGHGMTPDVLAHAFEPFFTTKEPGKGTGLGLSTVYGFAVQSGGQLKIRSRLGYGTRVELFLPVADAAPASGLRREEPRPLHGSERVLVVEDDPEVRSIAVRFLGSLGYRVDVAADAEQALRQLAQVPDIALLFSDVALGTGLNGIELGRIAREQYPGVRVLLTSGHAAPFVVDPRHPDGEFELLRKPYRREDLAAAARRLLDRN